jgi:protein gp37
VADNTKIEWADATLNYVNGCSLASPGCTNCYAMKQAHRFPVRQGLTVQSKGGMVWTGEVRINDKELKKALAWKRGRRIFWNAHGDLFHENVPDEAIDRLFAVCALTPQHTHMILTKRSARMREYLSRPAVEVRIGLEALGIVMAAHAANAGSTLGAGVTLKGSDINPGALKLWPLPNVWLGVSVEDQQRADERIPDLLATPAAVRFISAEPLLGPVDLTALEVNQGWDEMDALNAVNISAEWGKWCEATEQTDDDETLAGFVEQYGREPDGKPLHPTLDWVIAGGESGPKARPMHPDWARSLRDQCQAAGVPFLFKQWGEWFPYGGIDADGHQNSITKGEQPGKWHEWPNGGGFSVKLGKKMAGRLLDGRTHGEFPA